MLAGQQLDVGNSICYYPGGLGHQHVQCFITLRGSELLSYSEIGVTDLFTIPQNHADELNKLLSGVIIASGGVLQNI